MKKIYLTLLAIVAFAGIKAATYTITISGLTYAPPTLTVNVGDVVTIQASSLHPLNQVSAATWSASGSTTVSGGWGSQTADYTFTASVVGDIYYVCQNHVSMGMKGMITVLNPTGIAQNTFSFQNLNVFPNPAKDKITVSLSSEKATNATFKLFSITGAEVSTLILNQSLNSGENKIELALPTLSNGNYILEITSESKKVSKKITVVN
ncbi:MAG: T9SS type A sorting domain-containing protein [Bacteroidota bacterium]|nr:T9SS type A sorting domain-containing protein [Bacteroidota bacterium]